MAADVSNTFHDLPIDLLLNLLYLLILQQKHWQHQPLPSRKKNAGFSQHLNLQSFVLDPDVRSPAYHGL